MWRRNETTAITRQWQRQIEESLEAGEALWLEVGISNRLIDHLPVLTALHTLAAHRTDVATPGLFVGGDGVLWAVTCMSPAVGAGAKPASGMALLYGGADPATYMATLATLPGPTTHTRQSLLSGLPAGLQAWLRAGSQPGVALQWSALPVVVATEGQLRETTDELANQDIWLSWLALLVVICLNKIALVV